MAQAVRTFLFAKATAAFDYLPSSTGVLVPMLGLQGIDREMILAWHREGNTAGFWVKSAA